MVRFSSNIKRPKVVAKQNTPLVSKEAPSNISLSLSKLVQARETSNHYHYHHHHSRSLPTSPTTNSIIVQEIGLTTGQAVKKLIEGIDYIINSKKIPNSLFKRDSSLLLRYFSLFGLSVVFLRLKSSLQLSLFCAIILGSELLFIELIEKRGPKRSISSSIKEVRKKLRKIDKAFLAGALDLDLLYNSNLNVPISTASSYTRVIRDGKVRLICLNLLVPGDFVVFLASERTSNFPVPFQPVILPQMQRKSIGLPPDCTVVLIEAFPATQVFEDQLKFPRRTRFIFSMLQEKFQMILSFALLLTFNKSFSLNQIIIPLIILSSPLIRFFWWFFSTCYISLLSEQLIKSKTPFDETTFSDPHDIDEFDEDAPPPVKNIKIPLWKTAIEAINRLFSFRKKSDGLLRLWDGDVIESLALISVLCFTDREGPISNCHSRPCELIIPTTEESELIAVELIPTVADPQLVRPVFNTNSLLDVEAFDLRALALAVLLSTECGHRHPSQQPHCRHKNILNELCHHLPEHLQTCYCNLSIEIGFDCKPIFDRFKQIKTIWHHHSHHGTAPKHKKSSSVSVLVEDQLNVAVYDGEEEDKPTYHLFTFGEVWDILRHSSFTFAKDSTDNKGSTVKGLSESLKMKLFDFEDTMRSCDINCVAFSYRPVFRDENNEPDRVMDKQVFLGLISVCPEPKEHFQELIDDLEAAGVRFAYFSPYREQPSKAFGERLGLETDWNSCILLSEHPNPASQSTGYSALSDIKARLPRGIKAIRPHLESVDDIPLHVSIFAECNSQNSAEMMEIYKESGEIVGVIGSCRSIRNSKCFGAAHLAIGIDNHTLIADSETRNPISFDKVALDINSISVKLVLPPDSSPYLITELIRESRTILQNSINGWEYLSGCLTCLILIGGISEYSSSSSSSFLLTISVFLMAIFISFGPHDPLVMKTHSTVLDSSKCPETLSFSFLLTCSITTIIRFIPSLISIGLIKFIFSSKRGESAFGISIILASQAFSFTHVYERRKDLYPMIGVPFLIVTFISFFYCLYLKSELLILFGVIVISGVLGGLCITWHEMIKSVHLKDYYEQAQKRAKLLFNTKLGMHSPV